MHWICVAGSAFELCFCKVADSIMAGRDFSEKMFPDKLLQVSYMVIGETVKADTEPLEKIVLSMRLNHV